ncbi:F0F1 ATP synthase subunit A [Maricaulis salignorans]|uniref:ATP synthase subunit a n=1 Tax=Maricaulis salignorans TaxID=144026 RepID=A0A1G9RLQ4_9PROT|nr:F0F1 ATP synthase subunit A [Maricaulis salignorans]SDM23365.1 ATP synthase F0 subcomplex A subunit [Maricaulis salignorans]
MALLETDPMHQFVVQPVLELPTLFGIDLTITNSALFMILTTLVTSFGLILLTGRGAMVPTRSQSIAEILYGFVADMVRSIMGEEGRAVFPYVFTLFIFILVANLLGMLPGSYTVTSQLVVTLALGLTSIALVVITGFIKNGFGFLKLFAPAGLPPVMYILIVPIEFISFLSRPFSLAIRLFANMMAGHTLLKLFGGFVLSLSSLGAIGIAGAVLPMAVATAVTALELVIAFLQAYVFAVLTCIYLNDALHPSH